MMYRHFPYLALSDTCVIGTGYVCTVLVLQVIQYSVCVYVWVYCELNECSCSAQTGQLRRNVQLVSAITHTVHCVCYSVCCTVHLCTSYSVQ